MGRARQTTGADAALADLARLKSSGRTSRVADYDVTEQPDIYDEVDDAAYAEHAARQRAAVREFVEGAEDDEAFESESESEAFARPSARARVRAPKRHRSVSRAQPVQPRRVSSAFLAPATGFVEDVGGPAVFDANDLARECDELAKRRKAGRKRRRAAAAAASVGDLLFDAADARAPAMSDFGAPLQPSDLRSGASGQRSEEPFNDGRNSGVNGDDGTLRDDLRNCETPTAAKFLEEAAASGRRQMDVDVSPAGAVAEMDTDDGKNEKVEDECFSQGVVVKPAGHASEAIPRAPLAPTRRQRAEASAAVAMAASKAIMGDGVFRVRGSAPLARETNGDVLMFWTDAHEVRVNGGEHLYLFGKAPLDNANSGVYASVCIQVRGIERALYVLPRSGKDAEGDVYSEICSRVMAGSSAAQSATPYSTNLPQAVRAKVVRRQCPFADKDAPRQPTDYLKVKFSFEFANALQPDSSGSTFARVFGTKTSASEMLCLKRNLKGPGWVRVSGASIHHSRVSHARHTLVIDSPKSLSVVPAGEAPPAPPLSALCISAKTVLNQQSGAHELVMLSGVFVPDVPLDCALDASRLDQGAPGTRDFVLLRAPAGCAVPMRFSDWARSVALLGDGQVEILPNEGALLNNLMAKIRQLDPDALLGHDMLGFGLDILLARMEARRTRQWSCLGRLVQHRDLSTVVKNNASSAWFKADAVAGRLVCDTYTAAKEILYKEKDYSLSSLAVNVLAFGPGSPLYLAPALDVDKIPEAFGAVSSLGSLVRECIAEARTAGRLSARLSILPLSKQLTCISGNLWSRTLQGARAQRIEFLLCHEFLRVGSKKGGDKSRAGDVTCKVLLPDKLSKADRAKVDAMNRPVGSEQHVGSRLGRDGGHASTPSEKGALSDRTPDANKGATAATARGKSTRRKPQYSGGLVLEPQKGFYDRYVLQLDFNSLYPSIIQEYNICFTTLQLGSGSTPAGTTGENSAGASRSDDVDVNDVRAMQDLLPDSGTCVGVLPRVLRELVSQRRLVKTQLKNEKDPVMRSQLDIRQTAIKLTANSLYGCLGFEGSRFYAQTLAALVTLQGRDTLEKTVQLVRSDVSNSQVIYGDTDSLFVATGMDDINKVRELGISLKKQVNARYKTLEIEIDAIYPKMLLLKKKKYAALKVVNPMRPDVVEREVKGLDLVRHDWCDLSHQASDFFLSQIFRGCQSDIDDAVAAVLAYLEEIGKKVRSGGYDLGKYVITKSLTKDPSQYPDAKSLPHVQVALRLRKSGRRVGTGDYIKYVVCRAADKEEGRIRSSSDGGVAEHAYHPEEVKNSNGKLEIDASYYLDSQVLPAVLRLCEPIKTIEASQLAVALGLDGRKYASRDTGATAGSYCGDTEEEIMPFMVTCAHCAYVGEFRGPEFASGGTLKSNGLSCGSCGQRLSESGIANAMTLHVRNCISLYYTTPFHLPEDGTQSRATRLISLSGNAEELSRKFTESWLHAQIRHVKRLMDVDAAWQGAVLSGGLRDTGTPSSKKDGRDRIPLSVADAAVYRDLLSRADRAMKANAYRMVDLSFFLAPLGLH